MTMAPAFADLIDSHLNLRRRVRNLETGVHPVGFEVGLFADFALTNFTLSNGWAHNTSGATTLYAQYEKRSGNVQFRGEIKGPLRDAGDGIQIATLNVACIPARTLNFIQPCLYYAASAFHLGHARIQVTSAGAVLVANSFSLTDASPNNTVVYLDGIVFPVG